MFLKQLEIQGFKSFAERTRLLFEPGMVAIVGPNGCGKSNVSDAIRWVLGEQRPSALRCSKMQDIIFNGTEGRKPLGMAEVTLLFSDCEKVLGTEYAEVSITRRSYRSGENQYFLNKTSCRLKDIQRLFMGTGVGTTSYSVMAQGQIDAILSSRPEDRRAVFEEAAGITKFKADRREATRKIEQTEANLARLTDIIREVKRQIGILQRQAEKARRYQELKGELRGLDVYITRKKVSALEERVVAAGLAAAEAQKRIFAIQDQSEASERSIADLHKEIQENEEALAHLSERFAAAGARRSRAQEIIQTNTQRMEEYRIWAERDTTELESIQAQIEMQREQLETMDDSALDDEVEAAQGVMDEAQEAFETHQAEIEALRQRLQGARDALVSAERRSTFLQVQLAELETKQHELILKKERLSIEQDEARKRRDEQNGARDNAEEQFERAQSQAMETREQLITLDEDRSFLGDDINKVKQRMTQEQTDIAALQAQIELLQKPTPGEAPDATPLLLDPANPLHLTEGAVVGLLAEKIASPKEHRSVVEIALAPWSRAVIVRSADDARQVLAKLAEAYPDLSVQLLVQDLPFDGDASGSIADYIEVTPELQPLMKRLLHGVRAYDTASIVYDGGDAIRHPAGAASDPIARKMLCAELEEQIAKIRQTLDADTAEADALQARLDAMTAQWNGLRHQLEKTQKLADQTESAFQIAQRQALQAEARFNEIDGDLAALLAQTGNETQEREAIQRELDQLSKMREQSTEATSGESEKLAAYERRYQELSARLTETRIRCASLSQQREHARAQKASQQARLEEIMRSVHTRESGIQSYEESIRKLQQENVNLTASLDPLDQEAAGIQAQINQTREFRQQLNAKREALEAATAEARRTLSEAQEAKNQAEIEMTESRVRRQTLVERMMADYAIAEADLSNEPCATWATPEEIPTDEWIESRMAKLSADITALGPVNLLAIEEFSALEERYTFLKSQEEDLIKSRDEILELIKTINETSGKMFRETFEQANANFGKMFSRLFNGGEAKLILLENEADPLECGIDIVARPPGKKPQTISLLSGGERTMTAVSLLFAIFLIKPAPFCLLDELDAALDDSNIGRFVEALKDFLVHSQFLIITHNQHTIAGSDIIYGVTMPEKGVSRTLSMRMTKDNS